MTTKTNPKKHNDTQMQRETHNHTQTQTLEDTEFPEEKKNPQKL